MTDNEKLMICDYIESYRYNIGKYRYIQSYLDGTSRIYEYKKKEAELIVCILGIMKDRRCTYTVSEVYNKILERVSQPFSRNNPDEIPHTEYTGVLIRDLVKSDILVEIKNNRKLCYRCNESGLMKMLKELSWFKFIYEKLDKETFENIDAIIEKLNIIAYNSEVTAYYTKKNANYTKALAFLNLIK